VVGNADFLNCTALSSANKLKLLSKDQIKFHQSSPRLIHSGCYIITAVSYNISCNFQLVLFFRPPLDDIYDEIECEDSSNDINVPLPPTPSQPTIQNYQRTPDLQAHEVLHDVLDHDNGTN
jgi:hypothetical protein